MDDIQLLNEKIDYLTSQLEKATQKYIDAKNACQSILSGLNSINEVINDPWEEDENKIEQIKNSIETLFILAKFGQ